MGRRFAPCLVALAIFAAAPNAHAQSPEAVKHFTEGRRLRDEGNCAAAIPAFRASLKAEESVGAYYNLGFCFEQLNQKQEAFLNYRRARQIAESKKDERTGEIAGAIASLELRSEYVRLFLPKNLPKGTKIRVDDEHVPENLYDVETTFFTKKSSAPHEVVVTAPGYDERHVRVDSKAPVPIELKTTPTAVAPPPPPPPRVEESDGWHWQRWLGLGVGVVGLGAFVYGGVEGLVYLNKRSDLDDRIQANECTRRQIKCDNQSPDVARDAEEILRDNENLVNDEPSARIRSLVPMIGGVLAMGGGAILFFTAPSKKSSASTGSVHVTPILGARQQGLSISGTF